MTGAARVHRRREEQRRALLADAQAFADRLDPSLGMRAVVVFGSTARGDFSRHSDVDVLIVAERLSRDVLLRGRALPRTPVKVNPVAWTPAEWRAAWRRRNPIAVESVRSGVWLVGSPGDLDVSGPRDSPSADPDGETERPWSRITRDPCTGNPTGDRAEDAGRL